MSVPNNVLTLGGQLTAALGALRYGGLPFVATPAAMRLEHDPKRTIHARRRLLATFIHKVTVEVTCHTDLGMSE